MNIFLDEQNDDMQALYIHAYPFSPKSKQVQRCMSAVIIGLHLNSMVQEKIWKEICLTNMTHSQLSFHLGLAIGKVSLFSTLITAFCMILCEICAVIYQTCLWPAHCWINAFVSRCSMHLLRQFAYICLILHMLLLRSGIAASLLLLFLNWLVNHLAIILAWKKARVVISFANVLDSLLKTSMYSNGIPLVFHWYSNVYITYIPLTFHLRSTCFIFSFHCREGTLWASKMVVTCSDW